MGTELFPEVDAGTFEIRLKTAPGNALEDTEKLVARIEGTIKEVIPEEADRNLDCQYRFAGRQGGRFFDRTQFQFGAGYGLLDRQPETRADAEPARRPISTRCETKLAEEYPLEEFLFVSGGIVNMALNEGVPTPISVQVSAGTLGQCRDAAERIVDVVQQIPGTVDVQIAQSLDYPQFDVQVDRTRAKYLGVDQEQVAQTVLTALGSSVGYSPTIWIDPKSGVDFFMGVQYEVQRISIAG